MALAERLAEHVCACFTGLWIESHEHDDALAEIASSATGKIGLWLSGTLIKVCAVPGRALQQKPRLPTPWLPYGRCRHCHRRTVQRFSCWSTSIAFLVRQKLSRPLPRRSLPASRTARSL